MHDADSRLRAAVYEAYSDRDEHGQFRRSAIERVIHVHRVAPLIECAHELRDATSAARVIERAVAERTGHLECELGDARRRIVLLSGRLAALGVNDLGQAA